MKTITLRAEAWLIDAARARARSEGTTLNAEFRRWLAEYSRSQPRPEAAAALLSEIRAYARTDGRQFSREEMNER